MRLVAFAGPSLPAADRAAYPTVTWRPPAARGDLLGAGCVPGDAIALIDGVIVTGHPPSPTECARVMEGGVALWGSSSLGALRAVELTPLGMRGVGWVYDRVADRSVTCDDELVAPLDPRSYEARTVFLVNVRFGIDAAVRAGLTTRDAGSRLIALLREVHFTRRSREVVERLAAQAGLPPAACAAVLEPANDVKRQDARLLLSRALAPRC